MSEPTPVAAKPELTDKERSKKVTRAMLVMFAIEVPALIAFWLIQIFVHNAEIAFTVLIAGLMVGSGYFVYQSRKLRPKDTPSAR